ncbi:MAG: hypothetical protein M1142_00895 [Patescibacteria group bacterium]|nr:hypothetical protein [Patescibacteria group bacterium]
MKTEILTPSNQSSTKGEELSTLVKQQLDEILSGDLKNSLTWEKFLKALQLKKEGSCLRANTPDGRQIVFLAKGRDHLEEYSHVIYYFNKEGMRMMTCVPASLLPEELL